MKKLLYLLTALFASATLTAQESIYEFTVLDQEEQEVNLSDYQGKVILVVNTAIKCGFTPQYTELQTLYEEFGEQGFVVLDFPCNQFGQQAPGTNQEIHTFCTSEFHTTFPQFDKIDVNGAQASPLFVWLKREQGFQGFDISNPIGKYLDENFKKQDPDYANNPDIKWNFTKFLIDKKGHVVARFEPTTGIEDIRQQVEELLAQ